MSPDDGSTRLSAADRARRVRVTAEQQAAPADDVVTSGIALPGSPVSEAGTVFLNGLIRAQLRLAAGCLAGFLLVGVVLTLMVMIIARTADPVLFGVPLSWLLQAYAFYPVILVFAVIYARGAARNERRYRALADDGRGTTP
ncbi:heavy metal transporter [Microbacterium soli]|uniref:Heavy metal transporter n=1 Tax=Microbacterium soli TaxID=446075 RepID=A0ABP7NAX9_9MICO